MKEGWTYKKLGEVCEVLNGYAFKSSLYVDKGIRVIRITNVQKGFVSDNDPKYYPYDKEKYIQQYILKENDLLISLTGNVGRVGLLNKEFLPAALNQRVACLRIKDSNFLLKFLFHKLNSDAFENDCIINASGIAQKNMSTEWLKRVVIPIPSLSEQLQIVSELDLLSDLIKKQKTQIEELDKLARSTFYDMFGDPVANEKGWEVKKIKEICRVITGNTPSRNNPTYYNNNYIEWIKTDNINKESLYPSQAKEYLSEEGMKQGRIADVGSILMACIAGSLTSIGKCCILDRKVSFNQQINAIVPSQNLNSFFAYTLINALADYIRDNATNGMKHILTKSVLEELELPLPPLALQQEFAAKIEAIEQMKAKVRQSLKETEELFNSRMDYYFN